jgi:hypothetical protein
MRSAFVRTRKMLGIAIIPLAIGLVLSAGAPTSAATGARFPKSTPQPDAKSSSAESTYRNPLSPTNDYQLKVSSRGSVLETLFSRAHVSFDGGKTWTT